MVYAVPDEMDPVPLLKEGDPMKKHTAIRLASLLICLALVIGLFPATALAAGNGKFVLVVEAGGKLVIAPVYVSYTAGQTVQEALAASGHSFTGLADGMVSAIDGVVGNFTRSDQSGDYALDKSAAQVTHFRFSEETSSTPSAGLMALMTAMADYGQKEADVRAAAKEDYDTALSLFVGIDSESAATLASQLNGAVTEYENILNGTKYDLSFSDGTGAYSESRYPGLVLTAENAYGRIWTDEGDGKMSLPAGDYTFHIAWDGLHVEGNVKLPGNTEVTAALPQERWLAELRLSGSYSSEGSEEHQFTDGEFTLGSWDGRAVTVPVMDTFTGAVYAFARYDTELLTEVPTLTAIYTTAAGQEMEKALVFESMTSGAYNVLTRGAVGNTVVYRISSKGSDDFTYSQDYTVHFDRTPTLTAISLTDQEGTDLAATILFDEDVDEYTYKVLDTVTSVTVRATPLDESYTVTVNGQSAADGATVDISGETEIAVQVSAQGYSHTYTLTVQPGEGKSLSFVSDRDVTVQVVNSNGVVMPYKTYKESATKNNYKYTLVPGETYSYIATSNTYYHMADEFRLEDVANSRITVDFSDMGDWLSELAFGTKQSKGSKGNLPLSPAWSADVHAYAVSFVDTEHIPYVWVTGAESDVTITASYAQIFGSKLYHGLEKTISLASGKTTGERLQRFLMDENPIENTLTIRLSKEVDGVTWYQDYVVEFRRELSLKNIAAQVDGAALTLTREDDTTGFAPDVKEYSVTVSMAAREVTVNLTRYMDNPCYGESEVGYRVKVDGVDVTATDTAVIPLDGTMNTQNVTITVENDKAPGGTGTYLLHILKMPPVKATFDLTPGNALLAMYETLTGQRVWPEEGAYSLCEGYSYDYSLTAYGYVGKSGTLTVTRDGEKNLVITDGTEIWPVTADSDGGGTVAIPWALVKAQTNTSISTGLSAQWPNFRGDSTNNGVTSARIPTSAEDGTLYWAKQIGVGFDADAVGSPILVDGDIITYAGDTIYRVDTVSGAIKATGKMDHKSSFAITPPTYAEGMVFVALSNGTVQAFNAVTLESLWIYTDPLGGQPNCPLTVKNGYLYTGFWNSETADANFVCLSITDEDPSRGNESKCACWHYTSQGGYYWAGAYAAEDYLLVGTDDGENGCTSQTSSLLLLDSATGKLLDSWDGLNGDVRSTVVYDSVTNACYFTSKGGSFYSVQVTADRKLTGKWSIKLENGTDGIPMSTCSPVVYNGRAYVGVSGAGQFSAYSGHNITVIDLGSHTIAYRVATQGYPQTSGLLTTGYDDGVYVYFFDNMTPGKLRVLRDNPGQTTADLVTMEGDIQTAYALFTPTGNQAQYAICSPIVDEYGTIYFKNDSAHLMAFGSAITGLTVTSQPEKTVYAEGETFDPTGMVVTATYANGKTRDVTAYVTWSTEALTAADASFTISFPYVMYHNAENGTAMDSGVATTTPTVTLALTISTSLLGDVNGDGKVDGEDAQWILRYEAGLLKEAPTLAIADVSGDGVVDSNDATLILQYASGKINQFPAEED